MPTGQEQSVQLIEASTYRSKTSDSIPKNSGVEKLCQKLAENSDDLGWILSNDQREETVIVSFETPLFINQVLIDESVNPGHVTKIEMFDPQQKRWWPMWQGKQWHEDTSTQKKTFSPTLRRYHLKSKTVRITIDPRSTNEVGIRAIVMIGSPTFDVSLDRICIKTALSKLYDQTRDMNQTDVQFQVEGTVIGAHQNILCCRSKYFRTLLIGDFRERNHQEPIELTDIDVETLNQVLLYIYTGEFHPNLAYDTIVKCMIYCNKIDFLPGKNAALERLCRLLTKNRDMLLSVYCLVKQMSPAFDLLLDYIYDLSAQHMNEICQQSEFSDLDKELMVDLICQAAERRDQRDQQRSNQSTV